MKLAPIHVPLFLLVAGCSATASEGEEVYRNVAADGNTFTCATCHALDEPQDEFTRPGHPIGGVTRRPSFKNGELTNVLDAANVCRREWMGASEWTEDSDEWLALFDFLDAEASGDESPALSFTIGDPNEASSGGDMDVGQRVFNGRCAVCHGENATGTQQAPVLVGDLLTSEQIVRRVRTSGRSDSSVYNGLTGGVMPFWSMERLNGQELTDVVAFVLANDPRQTPGGGGDQDLRDCDSTHPKIGQVAMLNQFAHQVGGTATIVNDCTIEITNFNFDGGGIDVRFYAGLGGDYDGGFSMSESDIRRSGGYSNETVYAQLPEGRTLDELDGISVWCVPVGASFGDGQFSAN